MNSSTTGRPWKYGEPTSPRTIDLGVSLWEAVDAEVEYLRSDTGLPVYPNDVIKRALEAYLKEVEEKR